METTHVVRDDDTDLTYEWTCTPDGVTATIAGHPYEFAFEIITPQKAARYLSMSTHNRELSEARIKKMLLTVEHDEYFVDGKPIVFDAKNRLIDGQHRLTVISRVTLKTLSGR